MICSKRKSAPIRRKSDDVINFRKSWDLPLVRQKQERRGEKRESGTIKRRKCDFAALAASSYLSPKYQVSLKKRIFFQDFSFLLSINLDLDTPLHHTFVVQIWLLCWNFFQFFLGCFRIGLNWIFNQHWIMVQISKCSQILEELEASPMGRMLV